MQTELKYARIHNIAIDSVEQSSEVSLLQTCKSVIHSWR